MRISTLSLALSVAATVLSGCSENGDVGPTSTTIRVPIPPGPLEVVTVTTGSDIDPDGYFLVDGLAWWGMPIGVNDRIRVNRYPAAEASLELAGVAANCTVAGGIYRSVTVAGGSASITFEIDCAARIPSTLPGKIVYSSLGSYWESPGLYFMDMDGLGQRRFFAEQSHDFAPALSPDGTRVLFESVRHGNRDIHVVNADGSHPVRLTDHPARDGNPSWSADGAKIIFVSERDGSPDLFVMNADGSSPQRLTRSVVHGAASWSPDGSRIAFSRDRKGVIDIYVMNADGTDEVNLTKNSEARDFEPAWSPDGTRIAFRRSYPAAVPAGDIYVIDADGSNPVNLTNHSGAYNTTPSWSPDGSRIVFTTTRTGDNEVFMMRADGSDQTNLTRSPYLSEKVGSPQAWGP